ncbi:NAD(P)/FAD-dependent oxidoreductase [Streptomyces sp. H27-D2]|uniref:NAD(P)/FAD-dependent oxidoreductase n=1 Tax=Streptomyces sp. H27-D2 TaxID=3046304 RepID=UPI002DB79831|nr:FAD-dependent oxidoreductase [Streptomyces sp. H27-D2]MEC4015280.1 FAD-dependent oxidoreductase [Streptomyces sp. H27-D2]
MSTAHEPTSGTPNGTADSTAAGTSTDPATGTAATSRTTRSTHHQVLVIGGGTAGISVAARLRRAGVGGVGLLEPSDTHYYQPLWTLVGGGCAPLAESARPEASLIPGKTRWIKDRAESVDPDSRTVSTAGGALLGYDRLVVCPGIQLDWNRVPGMSEALDSPYASSNYAPELAPKTWGLIRGLRSGTAVFTMPSGPIKCAGAPQKIAYLAADHWRREGVLDKIRIVLVLPTPAMFGVPEFAAELERVATRYGIEVRKNSELTEVDADSRKAVIANNADGSSESVEYDLLHTVPPQSAPDWIKAGPLAGRSDPGGYTEVDRHTLRHVRYPEIFALGDAGSTPNSKTGAAIRKQAPVAVENLRASLAGRGLTAHYDGYASCPITTARDRMLLAEFDYSMRHTPSFPFIDTTRERRDMWYLKRRGLPFLYWRLMLKGLA